MQGTRDSKPAGYTIPTKTKGYVMIKASGHHRADKYGWTYEYLVVAEAKYGMQITRAFTVHHVKR